jgi:hypothetical protein
MKTEPAVLHLPFSKPISSAALTHGLQKLRIAFLKDLAAAAASVSKT